MFEILTLIFVILFLYQSYCRHQEKMNFQNNVLQGLDELRYGKDAYNFILTKLYKVVSAQTFKEIWDEQAKIIKL